MAHLFLSYASDDRALAEEVCALLEARGIACWIAPRDVAPGARWDEAIVDAITGAGAFLLVLTATSNESPFVANEVNHAFAAKKTIFTFRAEDIAPSKSLGFYLARHHWTDGFPAPIDGKVARLAETVTAVLAQAGAAAGGTGTTGGTGHPHTASAPKHATPGLVGRVARRVRRLGRSAAVAWGVAGLSLVAALAVVLGPPSGAASAADTPVVQLDVIPPGTPNQNVLDDFGYALSPDGRQLAFVATTDNIQRLWVRALDRPAAQMLQGTEGAQWPFWSPDSRSLGFTAGSQLKRIDVSGGPPRTLCEANRLGGGAWNREGVILFGRRVGALGKVSASGGACSDALPLAPGQANQAWPQFLPDGRHVIFREFRGIFGRSPGDVFVGALDGGDSRRLLHIDAADSAARFASPASLLVVRQGALVSYAIDPAQGVVRGDPATVAGLGEIAEGAGVPGFSVSDTGVLAYRAQLVAARTSQLAWVDRTGAVLGTIGKSGATTLSDVQLSPDGRQVTGFRDGAVWLLDVNRGIDTRLTGRRAQPGEAAESAQFGVWSRDGRRVAFRSVRDGRGNLFEMPADGTGTERRLIDTPETKTPLDWSPDGRVLAYQVLDPATGFDIWALPLTGDGKPFPILNGKANEGGAQFSPDGRWLAYQSDESGDPEVFVQPFPGPGRRVQVSSGGGTRPRWRPDGKELFYLANDLKLMAVPIAAGRDAQALDPGAPMPLFQTQVVYTNSLGMEKPNYAVAPDGQRFLINTVTGDPQPSPITVVLNWPALLKKP